MAKQTLSIDYDFSFLLLGVSCHQPIYKLCWSINQKLKLKLRRIADLAIEFKGKAGKVEYLMYEFIDELAYREYFLIANHSDKLPLIPEHKQLDYFYLVKGSLNSAEQLVELDRLRQVPGVLAVFNIDPSALKSKENLIF